MRGSITRPCPGYAHTMEVGRFATRAEARDTLTACARYLVRLKLTPAWGVRVHTHPIHNNRIIYVVMLDGPTPTPPPGLPTPNHHERQTVDVVAFL